MLVVAGSLIVVILLFLGAFFLARNVRCRDQACPHCAHNVQGLDSPRCPECGDSLEAGVVPVGGMRPARRILLGTVLLVLSPIIWFALTLSVGGNWQEALFDMGLIYMVDRVDREIAVGIDFDDKLKVRVIGEHRRKDPLKEYEFIVTITQGNRLWKDQELAKWPGIVRVAQDGTMQDFDATAIVESLRAQIPVGSDSPFAPILHEPRNQKILEAIMKSFVVTKGIGQGSVSSDWDDADGNRIFDGSISSRSSSGSGLSWPSPLVVTLPVYLIPFLAVLPFIVLGTMILVRHRTLVPFTPYDVQPAEPHVPR